MATSIAKPVSREVLVDGRVHVATFTSAGVTLREKGKRTSYGPVPWGHIFMAGARMAAEELREERGERKMVRRVSRGLLR